MTGTIIVLCAAAVLNVSQDAATRGRPDFSGRWAADPPPGKEETFVPICNRECVMTQTSDALVVRADGSTFTYKFDGTPTHPPPREGGPPPTILAFRTTWKGDVLVIESEAGRYKSVSRLSLREGKLTIEGERPGTPDPEFKRVFRKVIEKQD